MKPSVWWKPSKRRRFSYHEARVVIETSGIIALICVVLLNILVFWGWRTLQRHKQADASQSVVFDAERLTLFVKDDETSFPWSKLEKIILIITDEGPFVDDQFYELHFGGETVVTLPSERKGVADLVKNYILQLDGVDERLFIEAMSTTTNKSFEIYVT